MLPNAKRRVVTTASLVKTICTSAEAQSIFSPDCICFPENEQPFFCFLIEEQFAAKVKCPLHGQRFKPITFHIYVGKWRRESEPHRRQRLSAQYQKAWDAGFPPEQWPAEETEFDGRLSLRLKDGTILRTS